MQYSSLRLSKRYARALLSLAVENRILDRSYNDMKHLHEVCSTHKELKVLLKSPVVRLSKKHRVLGQLFGKRVHPLILRYMEIIVKKQRGHLLEGIAAEYLSACKEYLGIEVVRLTTALPLNESVGLKAMEAARKMTPKKIEFDEFVDPAIIGGFVLKMGDRLYDASIKYRLIRVKKHLGIH